MVRPRLLAGYVSLPSRGRMVGRGRGYRRHLRQGASLGARGQRAAEAQAVGPSRGGQTTKIHALVDVHGRPGVFLLMPGNASDVRAAPEALADAPGTLARKRKIRHDRRRYRERWRIEATFCRRKDFRRIATRYDKLARNYTSPLAIVNGRRKCLMCGQAATCCHLLTSLNVLVILYCWKSSDMPVSSQTHTRRRTFIADTTALLLFFTTTGMINERFVAGMAWEQVFHARLLGAVLMVPVGRPYGIWRDWIMQHARPDRVSQLLWDSLALVSFQVPIYAAIIAVSGASGRGLLLGVLGATAMMLALGRPYGAFLNWVRALFGIPPGGVRPMSLNSSS